MNSSHPPPQRLPFAILALQNHRAGFEAFGVVLLAFRDGEASEVARGGEEEGLGEVAVVIVVVPAALAAQHHHRFGALPVAVDRQHGARLDGVEHALVLVVGTVTGGGA